ncbi:hypothetical protein Pla8534_04320 [Lignipirellula cremea]|uniref:Uncharacterized protein n=1 Tax=Lignipirellula cremea TaxID=2528010 RepID=A0A518DLG3_9BACT|nr:hypothetical protein Pla8534_04320 [Lignipirellula cremea]
MNYCRNPKDCQIWIRRLELGKNNFGSQEQNRPTLARSAHYTKTEVIFPSFVLHESRRRKYAFFHGVKDDCPASVLLRGGEDRASISGLMRYRKESELSSDTTSAFMLPPLCE